VSNVVQVLVGGKVEFGKQHITPVGPLIFAVLMLACAVGMWRKRYWAVLGFQALLALVVLFCALLLVRASNALGFVVGAVGVAGPGYLFFKLVRVLSRIQMPTPPGSLGTGRRR
jgi:threonine/homoserine/homoserine lactone efflux protein